MTSATDLLFLRRTLELAERGLYSVSGNPRVGCLIVRDGTVIGRGWHRCTGEPHAEAEAIADAGGDIRGATVYVSLEPCSHTGRQPPCVAALIAGGAARVVAAMEDPDPRVRGRGVSALRAAGIDVDIVDLAEAHALNAGFVARHVRQRPWVRVKLAASLDGRTALASGESRWITSPAARSDVQRLRARSCAIVTGIGTVVADDPALTVRENRFAARGVIRQPLLAVADSRARTPAGAKLFDAERPVLIFAAEGAAKCHPRGKLVAMHANAKGGVDLVALLEYLAGQDCNEVLVEAGATLAGAFLRERLWDEAVVYLAPKLLGHTALPLAKLVLGRLADAAPCSVHGVEQVGTDLRVVLRPAPANPAERR